MDKVQKPWPKYCLQRGRKLKMFKSVVVHWPGPNATQLHSLWNWMRKRAYKDPNSGGLYHYLIDIDGTVNQTANDDQYLIHTGYSSYKERAQDFFGDFCPDWEHTSENPHRNSPNNCSIGVCMMAMSNGKYSKATLESSSFLVAQLCHKYGIQAPEGVFMHTEVVGDEGKICPAPFVNNPEAWDAFLMTVLVRMGQLQKENPKPVS